MPFSNPFTSRKDKRSSAMYPPGYHNGSVVDSDWHFPQINDTTMSTHAPFAKLDFGFSPVTRDNTSTQSQENVQQYLQGYQSSSSSEFTPYTAAPQSSKPSRYYSHALSEEDKAALAHGELNHNLQEYTPADMVMYHEARKSLVPQGSGANKLRKMEAFAKIEEEKQHSQRALDKKASQSMYDLRSSSASVSRHPVPAPASPPVPTLHRKYSWEAIRTPSHPFGSPNVRTAGGTDYFSYHLGSGASSNSTSNTSSRMPSLLSNTDIAHQHNPTTTFDTFLVPHKSGKGEAYRGAANATGLVKERALRRFTKIRSTPTLRQRFSRSGLRQDGDEVPDVPALP